MKIDALGLALSGSCLIHCLVLPVAVVAAPSLSVWLGQTESVVHWVLLLIAIVVSGSALYSGFRRHGTGLVLVLGVAGLSVMAAAAAHVFGRTTEAGLTVVGAAVVAVAHVVNLRLTMARPDACSESP
jgi:MFS-type transporter involved in bile tolerance (Atg22 family)